MSYVYDDIKKRPASEAMLNDSPHKLSSCSANGRQISSRQVETRLIEFVVLNPFSKHTELMHSMNFSSAIAPGKSLFMDCT